MESEYDECGRVKRAGSMASGSSLTETGVIGCVAEGDGSAPKWTFVVVDGDTDVENTSSERSSRKGDN